MDTPIHIPTINVSFYNIYSHIFPYIPIFNIPISPLDPHVLESYTILVAVCPGSPAASGCLAFGRDLDRPGWRCRPWMTCVRMATGFGHEGHELEHMRKLWGFNDGWWLLMVNSDYYWFGGFHSHGGIPKMMVGMMERPIYKWMMTGATRILWKPPYEELGYSL